MIRPLTPEEEQRAENSIHVHTPQERLAYRWLPESLRKKAKRFTAMAFENYQAYYPDLLFPDLKIDLEIDGGYHNTARQHSIDRRRDRAFKENGYAVIRIKNMDLSVNVAYWERMTEALSKLEPTGSRAILPSFIAELEAMTAKERQEWTLTREWD